MVELMLVVLVMAILATLATGLAIKVMEQARKRKNEAIRVTLQSALVNYRAGEQRWPLTLEPQNGSDVVEFRDNNARVFAPLVEDQNKRYLEPPALLTKVSGKGVMPFSDALKQGIAPESCPLGYLDPANRATFRCFKVTFNMSLETVDVGL